ncbi:MAG TPA: hypothetical protein VJ801_10335 [Polyangia bacterium]|jgi:hypothetical protein|nr:hypothetical protein [Polyangia bacterium]
MKKKLLIAALAMVGGCDHQFGIGALEPDTGVAILGRGAANAGGVGYQGPTTWTGYVEDYQFPSGSSAIWLAFSADSSGRVAGMVFLGQGPPPPRPGDPNVGYPPDYSVVVKNAPSGLYWAEGFAYSMVRGQSAFSGLEFSIQNNEFWSAWCALQTSVDASGTCLPNWQGAHIVGANGGADQCYQQDPANGRRTVVDCGKYDLCITNSVCMCSTTPCVYDPNGMNVATFSLALPNNAATGTDYGIANDPGNNTATGTVYGLFDNVANVYFTQDP